MCKGRENPRRWEFHSRFAGKMPPRCKIGWNIISQIYSFWAKLRNNVGYQLILQHRDLVL